MLVAEAIFTLLLSGKRLIALSGLTGWIGLITSVLISIVVDYK